MAFTEEFTKIRKPDEVVYQSLKAAVESALAECTDKQRAFFPKVFPKWPDNMSEEKLRDALDLCNRTIAKNRAGRS